MRAHFRLILANQYDIITCKQWGDYEKISVPKLPEYIRIL